MQTRLALLARNCRDRMRDPPDSRTRRLSSVQRVRTSQRRGALLAASVPAGPGAGCGRRLLQPLTRERAAKEFLWVRQSVRRQHMNLTLSLVCAQSPRAHVSVFLGPKQPFSRHH